MNKPVFPWSFPTRPPAATPAPAPNNTPVDMEPPDEPQDDHSGEPFCECNAEPTIEEQDFNRCGACGKWLK